MPTISEISSRYIDEVAQLDPVRGERWGVASDPTRLTDYSPAGYAALRALLGRTLDALAAAEPPHDEAERLGAGFLADWIGGEAGVIDAGERERGLSIIVGPPASTRSVFDLMDRSTPEAWANDRRAAARRAGAHGRLPGDAGGRARPTGRAGRAPPGDRGGRAVRDLGGERRRRLVHGVRGRRRVEAGVSESLRGGSRGCRAREPATPTAGSATWLTRRVRAASHGDGRLGRRALPGLGPLPPGHGPRPRRGLRLGLGGARPARGREGRRSARGSCPAPRSSRFASCSSRTRRGPSTASTPTATGSSR